MAIMHLLMNEKIHFGKDSSEFKMMIKDDCIKNKRPY